MGRWKIKKLRVATKDWQTVAKNERIRAIKLENYFWFDFRLWKEIEYVESKLGFES